MILVTGARGFLGSVICRLLPQATEIMGRTDGVDLRDPLHMMTLLQEPWSSEPRTVIHCAYPHSNGIGTMMTGPASLVHDLMQIDLNVIEACARLKVKRLICFGSVCAYPESVTFPTGEDQLWNGYPEAVNAPYGTAKRMQLELLRAYRHQYGLDGVQLILGNLYGPGDQSDHVIPATIRKVLKAKAEGARAITIWGDGSATRDFLHVEDAAMAVLAALTADIGFDPVNVCSGDETHIGELVTETMWRCGYTGRVIWDDSKPNGQRRRQFSHERAQKVLRWAPSIPFPLGLSQTIDWLRNKESL